MTYLYLRDGSYALVRTNENTMELVSNTVASRTVWNIQTDELFVVATSQRTIVVFFPSFGCNRTVFSWMGSSGSLGWGIWDFRGEIGFSTPRVVIETDLREAAGGRRKSQ